MVVHDLPGHAAAAVLALDLQQQALAQVARAYARRVERLHNVQGFLDRFQLVLAQAGDLLERRRKVPVFVQVADDGFGRVPDIVGKHAHAELRMQVVGERHRRRKERFERRLFHRLGGRALIPGVEVLVEKRSEIDLVEGVGRGGLLHDFGDAIGGHHTVGTLRKQAGVQRGIRYTGFERTLRQARLEHLRVGRIGHPLRLQQGPQFLGRHFVAGLFRRFLEHRVLDDLLVDHLF